MTSSRIVSLAVLLSACVAAHAAVDQVDEGPFSKWLDITTHQNMSRLWTIQSFTAGETGFLTRTDLGLWRSTSFGANLTVQVFTFDDDEQVGTLLGQTQISADTVPSAVTIQCPLGGNQVQATINWLPERVFLRKGRRYAIAVDTDSDQPSASGVAWCSSDPAWTDLYPGGQAYYAYAGTLGPGYRLVGMGPAWDLGFRTYVRPSAKSPVAQPQAGDLLSE